MERLRGTKMKQALVLLVIALVSGAASPGSSAPASASSQGSPPGGDVAPRRLHARPFSGTCVAVQDGDTARVATPDGQVHTVHLYGVRAPLRTQSLGGEAAAAFRNLALGRRVRVTPRLAGPQGATYAEISADGGPSIGLALLRAGWGWFDDVLAPEAAELGQAMANARREGAGVWALSGPQDPRARWREGMRPGR